MSDNKKKNRSLERTTKINCARWNVPIHKNEGYGRRLVRVECVRKGVYVDRLVRAKNGSIIRGRYLEQKEKIPIK